MIFFLFEKKREEKRAHAISFVLSAQNYQLAECP